MAIVLGLLLGRFALAGGGGPAGPAGPAGSAGSARPGSSTEAVVAGLEGHLQRAPDDPHALTRLGLAYLARAHETADSSYVARASGAIARSLAVDGARAETMTAAGLIALEQHDFAAALEWGGRAHSLVPDAPDPVGLMVDAYVELGRYGEALDAAQRMVDLRPSLASLARVSYLRELHGDRPGAIEAMTRAAVAGSGRAKDEADVHALLGDLHLGAGDLAAARRAYGRALAAVAGHGPATVGLARADAATGNTAGAVTRLEPVVRGQPEAAWVALLGDLYEASGRPDEAAAQYDLVRRIEALNREDGVAVDLELARFEADHGRPEAVDLARTALATRPTIYAADALGWALRQAGRPEEALGPARDAVRLGTADGVLWYHLAAVEADLGLTGDARTHLERAFALSPFLTVRDLPAARALAVRLGAGAG